MAKSTGIILAAGTITVVNEFAQGAPVSQLFRPAIATLGAAIVFSGLEKLSEQAAVGIAVIALITVLIGGVNPAYKPPAQEVIALLNGSKPPPRKAKQ